MGRELTTQQKQQYAASRRRKYRTTHPFEHTCPRCGREFRWLTGHSLSSVQTHPCAEITVETLRYPVTALARRISRELPLFRAGSCEV